LDSYGSRGQQRTAILALKLAEIEWVSAETGDKPILLLDDVMAELDGHRRDLLQAYIMQASQAIITATETRIFSAEFLNAATLLSVQRGRIQPHPLSDAPATG
jgi:DNA replication and repair protein RecF